MTAKVLESFGGKLAEQWVATLLTPALVFWAGGFAAIGWGKIDGVIGFSKQSDPLKIAILAACLCGVTASAFLVQRFDLVVLRGLEGYWHLALCRLFKPLTRTVAKCLDSIILQRLRGYRWYPEVRWLLKRFIPIQLWRKQWLEEQWRKLDEEVNSAAFARYDAVLHHFPTEDTNVMPTRLGNILRAAELRSLEKYGLNAFVCWPHLWLLMPEASRKELQEARTELNTSARIWLWSVLFSVWAIWALWALPVAIFAALFAYKWLIDAAIVYGDLIDAAFDLYRPMLYQSLRWPLPANPAEEKEKGIELTKYLWRGSNRSQPLFSNPDTAEKSNR